MEQPTPSPLSSHVTHCSVLGGRPSARVLLEHARCEAGLRSPVAWFVHLLCDGVTCPAGQVRPRRRPSLGPRLQGKGLGHRRAPHPHPWMRDRHRALCPVGDRRRLSSHCPSSQVVVPHLEAPTHPAAWPPFPALQRALCVPESP